MSGRRSRLARKASRLERSPVEAKFTSEMNSLRAERDEAFRKVNVLTEQRTRELHEKRGKARKDIWVEYDSQRNRLIQGYAGLESLEAVSA